MKWWMSFRSWLWIAYGLVLFAGTLLLERCTPYSGGLVASHDLPAGRLLLASDVSPIAGSGQYLTHPVKSGDAIKPGDISPFPTLSPGDGDVPLALPIRRDLVTSGVVNAGSNTRMCGKMNEVLIPSVPVRTVLCPPTGPTCIVIASSKAEDITKAFAKDSRPYLQPVSTDPSCK
jgi:hypothetical protein